jgi:hypothetical protein
MRTTVTLDSDVEALLREHMRRRGLSFKEALNQAVRLALGGAIAEDPAPYTLETERMGYRPELALDKALALATEDEDREIARKLSLRK